MHKTGDYTTRHHTPFPTSIMNTTICAQATPTGGAIGLVRVSGPQSIAIVDTLFKPLKGEPLSRRKGHTATFGQITDEHGECLDEVLVTLFRAPHSYTGEDGVEISCHGSAYIMRQLVQRLLDAGCCLAQPGEFTQRAFINGKMDLSQAEAVADLIASDTAANHRMAISQLKGHFSNKLRSLREELIHIASMFELELDFSDHEDIQFADRSHLLQLAEQMTEHIGRLCQSFKLGNALKRGIPVAIIGKTNAGKSTLLNVLVGEERALVSDVDGTTRDTIEEHVVVDGTLLRFIDTAGIRHATDQVERMGIDRTFAKIEEAEVIIWLLDATQAAAHYAELWPRLQPLVADKQLIVVINKTDLLPPADLPTLPCPALYLSARHEQHIDTLRRTLSATLARLTETAGPTDVIVSNERHYQALQQALASMHRVMDGLTAGLPTDLVAQDLRECIAHLGDILGEVTSTDLLHNVFSHFCIGK